MQKWSDLKPRSAPALVGEVEMVVREMPVDKWEKFADLIATGARWAELAGAAASLLKGREATKEGVLAAMSENLPALTEMAQSLVRDVFGKSVPALALLAVDYPANDKVVAAARGGDAGAPGEALTYARENMTARQAAVVLELLLEVNDVGDLLGKFSGLGRKAAAAFKALTGGERAVPELAAAPSTH